MSHPFNVGDRVRIVEADDVHPAFRNAVGTVVTLLGDEYPIKVNLDMFCYELSATNVCCQPQHLHRIEREDAEQREREDAADGAARVLAHQATVNVYPGGFITQKDVHRALVDAIEVAQKIAFAADAFSRTAERVAVHHGPVEVLDLADARVRCLRCGGPAGYLGIVCEREGGCRTAEERAAAMEPERFGIRVGISRFWPVNPGDAWPLRDWTGQRDVIASNGRNVYEREPVYFAEGGGVLAEHPTREGALAAWRAKLAETLR